jgi:transmembrane sensor
MADEQKHIDYFDLTVKYLSGETSDAEVKLLEAWVLSSPEHKTQFNKLRQAWQLSIIQDNNQGIDVDQEWASMESMLFSENKVVQMKSRRPLSRYLGIAAAFIAIIAAALWVFIPSGGEVISTQNQVAVNTLPDGSQVSLNQYASVEYEPEFDDTERRLKLKGDAFFEVERDPEKPFIVDVNEVEVKVLGTAFYVDSRGELPNIEVIVQSGTVEVSAAEQSIILNAGETGVYEKSSRQLSKQSNEDENFLAWKTDILVFDNERLDVVIRDLNRKFHANIEMDIEDTSNCFINATFEGKSLESILKIIEKTHGLTTRSAEDRIIFSGDECL